MAKDEMETITEDRWDDDIWGIEHEDADTMVERPRLIFYFGENVCLPTRDEHVVTTDEIRITGLRTILAMP